MTDTDTITKMLEAVDLMRAEADGYEAAYAERGETKAAEEAKSASSLLTLTLDRLRSIASEAKSND